MPKIKVNNLEDVLKIIRAKEESRQKEEEIPKAQLILYSAMCSSQGLSEGTFLYNDPLFLNDITVRAAQNRRYSKGLDIVKKNIKHRNLGLPAIGYLRSIQIYNSFFLGDLLNITKDEDVALQLIDYAKENIKGASDGLRLLTCSDGMIKYTRNIWFEGWGEQRKDELIDLLRQSGHVPGSYIPELIRLKTQPEHYIDMAKAELEERAYEIWDKALAFSIRDKSFQGY